MEEPVAAVAAPAAPAAAGEEPAAEIDHEIAELEQEMEYMEKETAAVKDLSEKHDEGTVEQGALMESDSRSVYVGNVDYGATPEELQEHFKSCGEINRITIMVDKYTCCPKGFAYMEFKNPGDVQNACLLNDSLFRGRQLKVTAKRTNIPGYMYTKGKAKGAKGPPPGKPVKGKGKAPKGYSGGYQPAWGKKGKGKSYSPY